MSADREGRQHGRPLTEVRAEGFPLVSSRLLSGTRTLGNSALALDPTTIVQRNALFRGLGQNFGYKAVNGGVEVLHDGHDVSKTL